jgi:hypothetical protein
VVVGLGRKLSKAFVAAVDGDAHGRRSLLGGVYFQPSPSEAQVSARESSWFGLLQRRALSTEDSAFSGGCKLSS